MVGFMPFQEDAAENSFSPYQVRTQGEGGHRQAVQRIRIRDWPCCQPDRDVPVLRIVKNKLLFF